MRKHKMAVLHRCKCRLFEGIIEKNLVIMPSSMLNWHSYKLFVVFVNVKVVFPTAIVRP